MAPSVRERGRPIQATNDNTILRMRFSCWITETTNTQYIIHIASARQQCFREHASVLRYTYIACILLISAVYQFYIQLYKYIFLCHV